MIHYFLPLCVKNKKYISTIGSFVVSLKCHSKKIQEGLLHQSILGWRPCLIHQVHGYMSQH